MKAPEFPPRVYVTLAPDGKGAEELAVAFAPEDCEGVIGVYELVSVGQNETRFVEEPRAVEASQR